MLDTTQLIDLLAETDALWTPVRDWSNNHAVVAVEERREQYQRNGLPISNGGGTAAERKQWERELDGIEVSGTVLIARERGRRAFWRLGNATDWRLRNLVGLPGRAEMLRAMQALAGHEDAEQERGVNLVPETWLTGPDGWGTKAGGRLLVALEEMFLPALVRGWVTAWSDCEGRVAYQTTEAGRAFLAAPGDEAAALPEFDGDAADTYLVALTAARNALAAAKPAKENALTIPLSVGLWPGELAAKIPPLFNAEGRSATDA